MSRDYRTPSEKMSDLLDSLKTSSSSPKVKEFLQIFCRASRQNPEFFELFMTQKNFPRQDLRNASIHINEVLAKAAQDLPELAVEIASTMKAVQELSAKLQARSDRSQQ
jgi:hypothetical protein